MEIIFEKAKIYILLGVFKDYNKIKKVIIAWGNMVKKGRDRFLVKCLKIRTFRSLKL